MKRQFVLFPILFIALFISASEYDIKTVYQMKDLPQGSKVISGYGDVKDANQVLIPTKLDKGKYVVRLTRLDMNFYKIESTDYYIETKYCYEYANYEEVVLIIDNNYSFTIGKVIFD